MSETNPLLKAALEYAALGWKVFPLVPGQKVPATPNGFKDASFDKAKIEDWWFVQPNANIGIATGKESNLTVVDVDSKNNGMVNWGELDISSDEMGRVVWTPRTGLHAYYTYNPDVRTTVGLLPGIDIRNDGAYVVAPPSTFEGNPYRPGDRVSMLSVPLAITSLYNKPVPVSNVTMGLDDIIEGGRNDYLTKVAGMLQRKSMPVKTIQAALHAVNEQQCFPPLSDKEV